MSVPYYGDFAEDDTVDMIFNAFTSDDPSASATITNFINTDVHIHKDLGLTQRNNAAGITVSVDFDGITGNHAIKIDTSDDTVAAFWVTGSEYQVRIEGTTVDGATVNVWVGSFSIERAGGTIALLKLIQAAVITNAAGVDVAADIIAVKAETAVIVNDTDLIDDVTNGLAAIKAEVEGLAGAAMRGTDGANTTVPDAAGVAAGLHTTTDALVTTVDTVADGIQTDLSNVTDGLGALKALIDALNDLASGDIETACGNALTTYDPPTRAELTTDKNAIIAEVDANEVKIDALNNLSAVQVNAEVVDALNVDTYGEPSQEAPGATVSLAKKISYLYKAWRNKKDNDGTTRNLYADDEATVDQKSPVAEAAGTVTTDEWGSGP